MAYVSPIKVRFETPYEAPPGVFPQKPHDNTIKYITGDTLVVSTNVTLPGTHLPAGPENSIVVFAIAEDRFATPLCECEWGKGIEEDPKRKGLIHITVPDTISSQLRRGEYVFSVRVSDALMAKTETQMEGCLQVDYDATSAHHSVPYEDGTAKCPSKVKDLLEKIIMEDGTIMIKDEDTGLYHKVVVVKDEAGDANLGVSKAGVRLRKLSM